MKTFTIVCSLVLLVSCASDKNDVTVSFALALPFKPKVLNALGRSSYKIIKNSVGVPLRRVKLGYLVIQPTGQKLCTVVSYTLTEQHQGGGRKASPLGMAVFSVAGEFVSPQ